MCSCVVPIAKDDVLFWYFRAEKLDDTCVEAFGWIRYLPLVGSGTATQSEDVQATQLSEGINARFLCCDA